MNRISAMKIPAIARSIAVRIAEQLEEKCEALVQVSSCFHSASYQYNHWALHAARLQTARKFAQKLGVQPQRRS